MRRSLQWIPLSIVALSAPAWAHGPSKSVAEVVVDGARAEVRVTIAEHDLREGLEALDPARAGRLSAADLDVVRAHVRDGTTLVLADGRACPAERIDVRPSGEPIVEVEVTVVLTCPEAPGDYQLALGYLPRLVPPHVTLATITAGETRGVYTFAPVTPRFSGHAPGVAGPSPVWIAAVLVGVVLVGAWVRRRRRGGPSAM